MSNNVNITKNLREEFILTLRVDKLKTTKFGKFISSRRLKPTSNDKERVFSLSGNFCYTDYINQGPGSKCFLCTHN